MAKTICIDFDGTIAEYNGWKGQGVFGCPVDGVRSALERLKEAGRVIIIHTTRGEEQDIVNYLGRYKIPWDYINHNPFQPSYHNLGKPLADVYIDDRALRFNGCWEEFYIQQILKFKPWYKQRRWR